MEKDLTSGNVAGKLLTFAVPIFGANLLQSLYGTVDMMVVGRFADAAAVSAVSTGAMTLQTITGIVTGLSMGSTVLLGQNIGRKDSDSAARTVASSLLLFVVLAALLAAAVIIFALPLASVMNAPEEAVSQTVSYIRICGAGLLFIVLFNALSSMFRGIGDSATPLLLVAIACVCNIFGDLLLVGLFGLGASGAAYATVTAQGISVLCAALATGKRGWGFKAERSKFVPARQETLRILQYGLPIAAQEALTGVSFMVLLAILNSFGLVQSAGVGIAEKICGLMFIVPGAVLSAVSAFTAQNIGAGRKDRAKKALFISMGFSFSVGVIMFFLSFFDGVGLSALFSSDPDVCLASADYLRSYSIDCMLVSFSFSMMGYLNGNGRTAFVALQGILSTFLVRIPVAWFMSRIPGISLFQIGFATPLATLFAIILLTCYLLYTEKKERAVSL